MAEEHRMSAGGLDPETSEEELLDEIDDPVPSYNYFRSRVVGVGASAGGIPALQRFLGAMPVDSGMSFVVIVHLAPEHESLLSDVLQKATKMPVEQASDGALVRPNHVYVIPPAKHLSLVDGHLHSTELAREHGKRMTVDLFFRSLADTHGPHSVGIVLSGADGDGALGIKRIKERGGLTIVQDPEQAEYPGMPQAALATDMVDWVLGVEAIPERLVKYHQSEQRLRLPSEDGPNPALAPRPTPSNEEAALRDVLTFLRARTGHDFSYYKRATIVRRVARRMQVNELDHVPAYLDYLRMHPGEAGALLKDLLISVTNFFRDKEAFEALLAQVPELFRNKTSSDSVRVWVPACATGEEAYSIAMLLSEHARTLEAPPALQVFATDLDQEVLVEARNGIYPLAITEDISEERLQRYFVKEHRGYRVRRELREVVLFAVHDLLKDSPFSRLDLVSCRNLLIYLNRGAQRRALDIFHFALRPDGRLFLGTSESVDDSSQLFQTLDRKLRIYAARVSPRVGLPVPSGPSSLGRILAVQQAAEEASGPSERRQSSSEALGSPGSTSLASREHVSWSELHLKLIEHFGPPSLIVNKDHDILHLSEGASQFLKFSGGEPSSNLFRAVNPMLRVELRAALFRAQQTGQQCEANGVAVDHQGERRSLDIRVSPAPEFDANLYLITFEIRADRVPQSKAPVQADDPVAHHLERELEQTKRHWRDIVEEHEASTEELKASNEELQAINEELRSATEELETSREELQSINEELTTVNLELKSKVDELGSTNSDLHNLMGATAIATIFLDRELCIMRFTPSAVDLFSLIPTDIGRPLGHLRHRLGYPELLSDAARVLQQLVPIVREVGENEGRFFLARLLPYRTTEDRIAGVVLTFVDVTELHAAREAVRLAQLELENRVQERTAELDVVNVTLREEMALNQQAQRVRLELQGRLVDAQEQERSRISRELHDEVGQQITGLMLALKALESTPPAEQTAARWRELRDAAEQVGREIHQLATELRPIALDTLGLARALSGYLDAWSDRSGISVDFFSSGIDEPRMPRQVETSLYRIVQEATNNVFKHASAKNVSVNIERRTDCVLGIVEDDGTGFDLDAFRRRDASHIGIAGMQERVRILGGMLTIESTPGRGTTVRVELPIPSS
ncbi:MAG TPA: chemotaxis protein CheB [Polyangiaceae bacterium]|nr:chemotaxis protein CheB [Polyangiaceae bacterium]